MIWKDISKKFDEEFEGELWLGKPGDEGTDREELKSFLHSTLDEYVRELLTEIPTLKTEYAGNGHDYEYHDGIAIKINEHLQELLTQHEENMK